MGKGPQGTGPATGAAPAEPARDRRGPVPQGTARHEGVRRGSVRRGTRGRFGAQKLVNQNRPHRFSQRHISLFPTTVPLGAFSHSANYYGDYPGNNPENHPPCGIMHNQFKTQKFKHLMLAMGPRDLNSAPYSPVHCSSHSMTSFQSSELTELPVVENSQLFAQRTVRPLWAIERRWSSPSGITAALSTARHVSTRPTEPHPSSNAPVGHTLFTDVQRAPPPMGFGVRLRLPLEHLHAPLDIRCLCPGDVLGGRGKGGVGFGGGKGGEGVEEEPPLLLQSLAYRARGKFPEQMPRRHPPCAAVRGSVQMVTLVGKGVQAGGASPAVRGHSKRRPGGPIRAHTLS